MEEHKDPNNELEHARHKRAMHQMEHAIGPISFLAGVLLTAGMTFVWGYILRIHVTPQMEVEGPVHLTVPAGSRVQSMTVLDKDHTLYTIYFGEQVGELK